jgi:hypothetical protein
MSIVYLEISRSWKPPIATVHQEHQQPEISAQIKHISSQLDVAEERSQIPLAMSFVPVETLAHRIRTIDDHVLRGKVQKALHLLHRTLELYRCADSL